MIEKLFCIGDKIEIKRIMNSDETENSDKYHKSQLVDILDDSKVNITMPIEGGKLYPLEIGERYQLCFYTAKGLFQCKCSIVERFRSNNVYIAVVRFTSDIEKLQRRQFYRLECIMDIYVRILSESESNDRKKLLEKKYKNDEEKAAISLRLKNYIPEWKEAVATDISGGGIRFIANYRIEKGTLTEVKLSVNIDSVSRQIMAGAKIISCEGILNRPGFYEHRTEMYDIPLREREIIIRYVFDEERKRRKRENK